MSDRIPLSICVLITGSSRFLRIFVIASSALASSTLGPQIDIRWSLLNPSFGSFARKIVTGRFAFALLINSIALAAARADCAMEVDAANALIREYNEALDQLDCRTTELVEGTMVPLLQWLIPLQQRVEACPGTVVRWPSSKIASHIPSARRYVTECKAAEAKALKDRLTVDDFALIGRTPAATVATQDSGQSRSADCSTITGGDLGDGGSTSSNCQAGNSAAAEAQKLSGQDTAKARAKYLEAANAYRRAGDTVRADAILARLELLIATLPSTAPSSAPAVPQATQQTAPPVAPPVTFQTQNPQGAPADQASTAPSDDTNSCPPAIPASYWQNGPNADYCAKASASCWERGAALYGYLCTPDPNTATVAEDSDPAKELVRRLHSKMSKIRPRTYRPPMSPQALKALAYTACKDASDWLRCIDDTELGILFAADGVVRAACASIADSIARHNQAVDEGPGPDWLKADRQWVCAPDPDVRAACAAIADRKAQLECVDAVYTRGPGAYGNALRSTLQKSINDGSTQK